MPNRLSPAEILLLQSVRGPEPRRREAWRRRQERFPLAQMPAPADALLSFVAGEWHERDADWSRLQGILRHTWVYNQVRLSVVRELQAVLGPLTWLDDVALATRFYRQPTQRHIHELAAWVPDLHQAAREMLRSGHVLLEAQGGVASFAVQKVPVRLHADLLPNRREPWSAEVPPELIFQRLALRAPSRQNGLWVADLLAVGDHLDATALVESALRRQTTLATRQAVALLAELELDAPRPAFPLSRPGPGEWVEARLQRPRLARFLLEECRSWRDLPWKLLRFAWLRLRGRR